MKIIELISESTAIEPDAYLIERIAAVISADTDFNAITDKRVS